MINIGDTCYVLNKIESLDKTFQRKWALNCDFTG